MPAWTAYVSLAMFVFSILAVLYRMGWRLGRIELKVDTMWEFLMRRAKLEGLRSGLMEEHSALFLSNELKAAFAPLMEHLRAFYTSKGQRLSDLDLMLALERNFGEEIVEKICKPLNVTNGACLVGAVKLLREEC